MIEIAIALAVIAFALVAIIGVLPIGMNVQRDNRAETIINHDAVYWMETIRGLSTGTKLSEVGYIGIGSDDLTNYVDSIDVVTIQPNGPVTNHFENDYLNAAARPMTFSTGREIVGLLSTPGIGANVAIVRTISGSATEKAVKADRWSGQDVAFRYRLGVRVVPVDPNTTLDFNSSLGMVPENLMNLFDIELRFSWPIVGAGSRGTRQKTYRSMASRYATKVENTPEFSATGPKGSFYYYLVP